MKNISIYLTIVILATVFSCAPPAPKTKTIREKHNYIILLDLSDRLIVQSNQSDRDKDIVGELYTLFEERVKSNLYVRSRDEIKVVIAPQRGSDIPTEEYEDKLYVNMGGIPNVLRRANEEERKDTFMTALNELYKKAIFSKVPEQYYGADIWKYFYEDLESDISSDTLTKNFLFILTDGYPIVGRNREKLETVNKTFPELNVILMEASPRDKDLEWDHIMELWTEWFATMNIERYTFIKRKAISKEIEQARSIIEN